MTVEGVGFKNQEGLSDLDTQVSHHLGLKTKIRISELEMEY